MTKRFTLTLAVLATVLALAFLLNPSPDRHRAKIKQAIGERSPMAGALGLGSLAAFASTYHSLGVASYTTAGDRTLSWGAFGVVVLAPQK
jgi:hypothetical protein